MADKKISELTAIGTIVDADLFAIVDVSATETKKVTYLQLKTVLETDLGSAFGVAIPNTQIAYGNSGSDGITSNNNFTFNNTGSRLLTVNADLLLGNLGSGVYAFSTSLGDPFVNIGDTGGVTYNCSIQLDLINNVITHIADQHSFSGDVVIQNALSKILFTENSGGNYVAIQAPASISADITWTLPSTDSTGTQALVSNGSGVLSWASIGGGSGTVTSFSAGDLFPLFTTSEATVTTTPALSFSLNTQNANKVFAGPTNGADAAPTFRVLVAADIPSLSGTYLTVDGATTGATSQAQVFTNGIKVGSSIDDNATGSIDFTLSTVAIASIYSEGIQIQLNGSAASPVYQFLSGDGFYDTGASQIGGSIGNALVGGFDATGLFAGLAGTLTGTLKFSGATSGTVTVQSAAAAGTWTLTLPTTDGNSGEFLQTNGSGVTTWAVPAGTGANTALSNLAAVAINTTLLPGSNDGAALGSGTLSFSDLFLASGGLINFANGNSVITHSSAVLTVSTGDLRVTTAGTNATSVATLDGTQTLTNKSIVATQLTGTAYTMAVNNTSGTAAYTLTNYRNDVIADYDGTFTWNSTPPSTIVSQKYVMSRIGNMVILTISVLYTSTGTTNTTCIVTFPSTAPAPAVLAASGDAASEYMYPITGARVEANQTANPSAIRGGIRRNSGNSAFEILLIFGSTSALQLQVTVIYFTA